MSYFYSDASRESDAHALPDVEIFEHQCGAAGGTSDCVPSSDGAPCRGDGWYFWFAFPGCMPDSDEATGPFLDESDALSEAREAAGFCKHGRAEGAACRPCDAKADETLFVIRGTSRGANNGRFACFATDKIREAAQWCGAEHAQRELARLGWPADQWEVLSLAEVKRRDRAAAREAKRARAAMRGAQ